MDAATVLALSEADASLGHLQGLGHLITDPQLLIGPYVTREALAEQGPNALNPWWRALPYPPMKRWWLKWPDAISATGNAQSRLRYDPP